MIPFKPEISQLGRVRTGSRNTILYSYDDTVDNIVQVVTPCTCSSGVIDRTRKEIKIIYTAGDIPMQIQQKGQDFMQVKKSITVSYTLKTSPGVQKIATLYFTAIVFMK